MKIDLRDKELFAFDDSQLNYLEIGEKAKESLLSPYATKACDASYFDDNSRRNQPYSNAFITDCDRILNNPLYNRYTDKTQVFSFCRNDDITRRGAHVQLVSRIARTIGNALRLNLDLIDAMALGHDIGHTPFGHRGEYALSKIMQAHCGKIFNHNVHSFRILHSLTNNKKVHGLTIQTLDGVLCHNGEKVHSQYMPIPKTAEQLLADVDNCYLQKDAVKHLHPSTLEGCVVRISDMIAYIGKDRQDLVKINKGSLYSELKDNILGKSNPEIIPRLVQNLLKNSIDKPYIGFSEPVFLALDELKKDNYKVIYELDESSKLMYDTVEEMMNILFNKFVNDMQSGNEESSVFKHHTKLKFICYDDTSSVEDIVCDYIASMTDDYFIDIYAHYFGNDTLSQKISYQPYEHDLV